MTNPSVPIFPYRDVFGNWCSRIVAPAGRIRLWADGVVSDTPGTNLILEEGLDGKFVAKSKSWDENKARIVSPK